MEIYRKDILVLLNDSPNVGYVFGSFVKVPRRGDKTFGPSERRTYDMNERFITSLNVTDKFDASNFSIIVKLVSEGSHFDMPDTRLRIDIDSMKLGHLRSEVRRIVNDNDRPETRLFSNTGNTVKIFSVAAIPQKNVGGYAQLDNLLVEVTDEQMKKIQKAKKEQKKIVDVGKKKKNSSSDYDSARSGIKVQSDSDSNVLKSGSLYASSVVVTDVQKAGQKDARASSSKESVKKSGKKKEKPGSFNWAEEMTAKEEERKKKLSSSKTLEKVLSAKENDLKSMKNQDAARKTMSKSLEHKVDELTLVDGIRDQELHFDAKLNDSFSSTKTLSNHGGVSDQFSFDLRNVSREMMERAFQIAMSDDDRMRHNRSVNKDDESETLDAEVLGERVDSDDDGCEESTAASATGEGSMADEYHSDSQ